MPLVMPKQSEYSSAPAGTHVAVCYRVVDLGTQTSDFAGEARTAHKILIAWELSHEAMEDGRPFTIARRYTLSSNKRAKLRIDLESWRGRAFTEEEFGSFDLVNVLGKGCLLGVTHDQRGENTYANVSGIMALPKGQQAPRLQNPAVYFDLNAFDVQVYASLSEGLREIIARSPEYRALGVQAPPAARSVPNMATPPEAPPAADMPPPPLSASEDLREKEVVIHEMYETAYGLGYSQNAFEKWETQALHGLRVSALHEAPLANLRRLLLQIQHWPDTRPAQSTPQVCAMCEGEMTTRCISLPCSRPLCTACVQWSGLCLECETAQHADHQEVLLS